MKTTTLSKNGGITIPKTICAAYGWAPGVEFVIEEAGSGILLKPRNPFPTTRVEDGLGCVGYDARQRPSSKFPTFDSAYARKPARPRPRQSYTRTRITRTHMRTRTPRAARYRLHSRMVCSR